MSLITRCPSCGTLFRVVDDQLKISQGWVRCGKCREVFDAPTNVFIADKPDSADNPTQSGELPIIKKKQDFSSSDWINSVNPPAAPYEDSYSAADNPPSLLPQDFTEKEFSNSDLTPLFSQSSTGQVELATPSFVRQAQRTQRWRSPWARWGLSFLVLLLIIGLGLQVALQERDRIAAAQPLTQPWLQELCQLAGCTVGPLKHIESVLVETSSFNKLQVQGKYESYKVALNLKNSGALAVAVPYIELSLNDLQDQPVLRRVLKPSDLGISQITLASAAEVTGSTTIQIDNTLLAGSRIAGYRVLAFYP